MPRQTDTTFEQHTDSFLFTLANKGWMGRAASSSRSPSSSWACTSAPESGKTMAIKNITGEH